jgi:two-component system, OmpR family, phosphate regulon sensor histidine kinase PhoR
MIYFPDSENLTRKVLWLCNIRWFAVGGILLATGITQVFIHVQLNFPVLYLIAGLLFLSNIAYFLFLDALLTKRDEKSLSKVQNNINFQILTDFIFLTLLLHYSGSIENPFIIFYIFHMVISSMMQSKKWTYIHTTFGILLFTSLAVTEYFGIIQHYSINKYISSLIQNDPVYLFSALVIFAITSYLVVYITSSLAGRLRTVERKLKEANLDLMEKDTIKDEYVKRVTHDIKGHVGAIKSNLEVVYKHFVAPIDPRNEEFIEKAYIRTQKISEFIYDLLALTNMRLNKKFDKEPIELNELLNNVVISNLTFAESKNIRFTHEFVITNNYYSGIKSSIEEVISNLVQNAIKYTREGGTVDLQAYSDDKEFRVIVIDSGFGIPEEDLPHIFEEFYRASNIKNEIKDGTGLGLSLVKAIVDRHLGSIQVESTVGRGSRFTVNLPHGY